MGRLLLAVTWLTLIAGSGSAIAESGYRPSGAAAAETTYLFAPHPYLNPQDLYSAYEPVMRYLERKIPGTRFGIETSRDYAAYEAKIAARSFHFGLPNPYQTVLSLEHGYRVIAKMTPDENFRGMMVARKDRKLRNPEDLAGKPLCFSSPTAVAQTMLPMLHLHQLGLNVKANPVKYVGSPISAIMHAYSGDAVACGTTVRFWGNWSRDNPDKAKEMETLWSTGTLPHNGVIARHDVPAPLARQVAVTLAGMDKDPELDQSQFKVGQAHFETATNDTYAPMSSFLKRYDEAIGLPVDMKPRSR
jgi:phosphonate transport system substrate-binding protein